MNEQQQGYLALAGLGAALGGALLLTVREGQAAPRQPGPISSAPQPTGDIASFGSNGSAPTGIPFMDTWPTTRDTSDEEET